MASGAVSATVVKCLVDPGSSFLVQRVKDPALPLHQLGLLLWCRFHPWPRKLPPAVGVTKKNVTWTLRRPRFVCFSTSCRNLDLKLKSIATPLPGGDSRVNIIPHSLYSGFIFFNASMTFSILIVVNLILAHFHPKPPGHPSPAHLSPVPFGNRVCQSL